MNRFWQRQHQSEATEGQQRAKLVQASRQLRELLGQFEALVSAERVPAPTVVGEFDLDLANEQRLVRQLLKDRGLSDAEVEALYAQVIAEGGQFGVSEQEIPQRAQEQD